jgi:hypothetical protein
MLSTVTQSPREHRGFLVLAWLLAALAFVSFGYGAWLLGAGQGAELGWEVQRAAVSGTWSRCVRQDPHLKKLQLKDRLISVGGTAPVPDAGSYFQHRQLAPGDSYEVVVERSGARHTYVLRAAAESNAARIVFFAVSLTWCVVGLLVGFARPESVLARIGCLSALATGLVYLQLGVIHGGPLWQPLHVVLGFHFLARFPHRPTLPRRVSMGAGTFLCHRRIARVAGSGPQRLAAHCRRGVHDRSAERARTVVLVASTGPRCCRSRLRWSAWCSSCRTTTDSCKMRISDAVCAG